MGYLVIVLILVIIFLTSRFLILRCELKRVSQELQDLNTGTIGGKLTVKVVHKPLEALCQQINIGIESRDKARVDAENHEAELRSQISNISHDLRTPLTAILGYLSMIKSTPERAVNYFDIIESRSEALHELVEQFYELSVIEDSHTELALEQVDITAVLTNCLLGNYTLFKKKGIEPQSQLPQQRILVMSNPQALERIFQNLIQNALKFAEYGITVSLEGKATHCIFTISNDAGNLTDADVDHLFDRFYTADKSRTIGNTGLGLYIVRQLLERTQGSVNSTSLHDGWFTLEIMFAKV